jgi:hypothetical protein
MSRAKLLAAAAAVIILLNRREKVSKKGKCGLKIGLQQENKKELTENY